MNAPTCSRWLGLIACLAACAPSASPPQTEPAPKPTAAPTSDETTGAPPLPTYPNPAGEVLLYDFTPDDALRWKEPPRAEFDELVKRFPHPHAAKDSRCGPDSPSTPPEQQAKGILLPHITTVRGAFTRPRSTQSAYLIEYCSTGNGQPHTVRLLVLQDDSVELDLELAGDLHIGEVQHAVDVDGDGRDEVVLTSSLYRQREGQSVTGAVLYRLGPGAPGVIGKWTAVEHCYIGHDDMLAHRIYYRMKHDVLSFRDETIKKHCYYPPPPPPR
ncbi:hypothetical protein QHF83_02780 [Polyangium sp. 15x6]|nr:hypothetical protein [Polyangium sp. 15x6]